MSAQMINQLHIPYQTCQIEMMDKIINLQSIKSLHIATINSYFPSFLSIFKKNNLTGLICKRYIFKTGKFKR